MTFTGRTAVVTGGGTGLGRAIALALAANGAQVGLNYSRSRAEAEATAAEIQAMGPRSLAVAADVSDPDAVGELVAAVEGALGPVDLLVNNAGTGRPIPFDDLASVTSEDWSSMLSVNVVGAFLVTQAVVGGMIDRGFGSVLNVASNSAFLAAGSSIPYVVSKSALVSLTQCLARALPSSVTVNCVAPGWMPTRWLERTVPDSTRELIETGALPSVTVEQVAESALHLLGSRAITGQVLVVDDGEMWRT